MASRVIDQDTLCIGCGYNLRGLEPEGRCPECALPIADSVRGDWLHFADPLWLGRLRFGTALKLWNILLSILVGFIGGLLVALVGAPFWIVPLITLIGSLLGLWATFCITMQEPRIALTEDPMTPRKVIRDSALTAVAASSVQQFGIEARFPLAAWLILSLVGGLGGLIVMVGELVYFRRFALRAPDFKLAASTKRLMWSGGIVMALMVVLGAFSFLAARAVGGACGPATTTTTGPGGVTMNTTVTPGPAGALAMVTACLLAPTALVLFLWYVVLLIRYRRLFQNAMEHSRRTAFDPRTG